ncbi:lysM and putative peptidoglycan-binding domain-containing protein 4 isoform X2 [Brachyhypopomus gauderio]
MRRGEAPSRAFQAPVDVHASADGQVYMFHGRQEEVALTSEDEELNVMELRPRNQESSSQERTRVGELLLLERHISHEDSLNKLALQYGCQVADIKRVNNLIKDQDLYALKSIKIPVKKHGLLTEPGAEVNGPQRCSLSTPPPPPAHPPDAAEAGSYGPQVLEYTDFLREVDSDIERLIQSSEAQEEMFAGDSDGARRQGSRGQHLSSYGADWGIHWWNAVIAMLLIGVVLPIFYVVYFKSQDSGESSAHDDIVNATLATSNSLWARLSTLDPQSMARNHLHKLQT